MLHFALFLSNSLAAPGCRTWQNSVRVLSQGLWGRKGLVATATLVLTCASPSSQMLSGSPFADASETSGPSPAPGAHHSIATPDTEARRAAERYVQLGRTQLTTFNWLAARQHFTAAAELDPGSVAAALGLANAHLGADAPQLALEHSRRALALTDGKVDNERLWAELTAARVEAAQAWRRGSRDEHRRLLQDLEEAMGRFPADAALYVLRGQVETMTPSLGRGGDEGTILWYRKALELDPDNAAAHHFLVYLLQSSGRLRAAGQHAERYAELVVEPQSHRLLVRVLLAQGKPRVAFQRLLQADSMHRDHLQRSLTGWGSKEEFAKHLRLLVAVEEGLGAQESARHHAEELFALASHGRDAGYDCMPLLEQLQQSQLFEQALLAARRCQEKPSLLARVLGAAYRGQANLALGRLSAARQALQEAQTAHRDLIMDLDANPDEKRYAEAAQLTLGLLEGKMDLLLGNHRTGERRLLQLIERLAAKESLEGWLAGRHHLGDITTLADRAGRYSLSITSSRALQRITPEGLIPVPVVTLLNDGATRRVSARSPQPMAASWVVWKER